MSGPRRPGGRRAAVLNVVLPVALLAVAVGAWTFVSVRVLDPRRRFLLPAPGDVLVGGLLNPANRHELLAGLAATAQVALIGLALAIAVGSALALVMSQGLWVERTVYPWAVVLQTIPVLAIVPLISFWFGYGLGSRVLVCVLIALFPIVTTTLFGLQSAAESQRDLFRLYRASRWQTVTRLLVPGALPSILTGWRTSAGLSVTGAIVGDFFFRQGQAGIGRLLDGYTQRLQSEQLFAGVLVSSAFGLVVFWAFGLLARWLVGSWHESGRAGRAS